MWAAPLLCAALFALPTIDAPGAHAVSADASTGDDIDVYLGFNPTAAFYGLSSGPAAYVMPFLTGHEYGLALSGGVRVHEHHRLELRLSVGQPNSVSDYTQLHVGYLFHVLDFFDLTEEGLYGGVFAKFADNSQHGPGVHYYSFIPYLAVGYWFSISRFFVDLRIEQTLMAVSVSDTPHTGVGVAPLFSPLPGISPILPSFVCSVGVVL